VIGFADEEGVRFASTLLGSRAVAGTFDERVLGAKDSAGISMRDALSQFGLTPIISGRPPGLAANCSAISNSTSNRGQYWKRKVSRSAW
jgi:hypothetical protein